MSDTGRIVRGSLMSLFLVCTALLLTSDLWGALASQSTSIGPLQLQPIEIAYATATLGDLVLNVTVQNKTIAEQGFQLGYCAIRVGQEPTAACLASPSNATTRLGVDILEPGGRCFAAPCKIPGASEQNPHALLKLQLLLRLSNDQALPINSTYQLHVFLLSPADPRTGKPYDLVAQGCDGALCVARFFYKYSRPELHPVGLEANPPSPATEGSNTRVFLRALIRNTGTPLTDRSSVEVAFRYCLQLVSIPCDPNTPIFPQGQNADLKLSGAQIEKLKPNPYGDAAVASIPLEEQPPVFLDLDRQKLVGLLRIKVTVKYISPNPPGELDESNNELLIPYRVLALSAITNFAVSPANNFGSFFQGVVVHFDKNGQKLCGTTKISFQDDPNFNCVDFPIAETTDMVLNTSLDNKKKGDLCDIFLSRRDGRIARTRCAFKEADRDSPLDRIVFSHPRTPNAPSPFDTIRIDPGVLLHQILLVTDADDELSLLDPKSCKGPGKRLLIAASRGKVWALDIRAYDNRPDLATSLTETVLHTDPNASVEILRCLAGNLIAVVNVGERGQLYLLKIDAATGRVTATRIRSSAGAEFEAPGRITAIEYDFKDGRLLIASSGTQSGEQIALHRIDFAQGQLLAAPVTCKTSEKVKITALAYGGRDITRTTGATSPMSFMAVGFTATDRVEGSVRFVDIRPGLLPANCSLDDPNMATKLNTRGPVSALRALRSVNAENVILPEIEQAMYVFATGLDGFVYPFRAAFTTVTLSKLGVGFVINEEGVPSPFTAISPIQAPPFIEESGALRTGSPVFTIYSASDTLYCRFFAPQLDSVTQQVATCKAGIRATSAPTLMRMRQLR